MATIKQRGDSYKITVSCGYDLNGKQIRRHLTWTPEPGMTKRQLQKELDRQAVLFEEKCRNGQVLDGNIKFAEFAEKWSWTMPKSSCGREPSAAIVKCSPAQRGAGSYAAWTGCSRIISFRFITIWLK